MRLSLIALASVAALGLAACNQGSAEKAGEKMDTAIEDATGQAHDMTDGAMENAGEALDKAGNAVEGAASDAGAAVDRATDGNTATQP